MSKRSLLPLLLIFVLAGMGFPQSHRGGMAGGISGRIYDSQQGAPIEYANIILYKQADSSQVTGTISDAGGNFHLDQLRPDVYYMEIYFIGYHTKIVHDITLRPPKMQLDLGKINIKQTALAGKAVVVEGEKAPITYKIDKKVIDVSQQHTAISGSAVDVLENVPSVSVDIEGNVSLRGSSNFRVLIDGRPTIMDAADALEQTPASTIDNIEIITNPSAKYDPEGTAGIINIILKKNQGQGRSGLVDLDAGVNNKYGGSILMETKDDNYSLTLGLDYGNRKYTGNDRDINRTTHDGVTSVITSTGASDHGRESGGFRGGLSIDLTPSNLLTLNARYGKGSHSGGSDQNFDQLPSPDAAHLLYTSANSSDRSGTHLSLNSTYLHRFARKGHELTGQLSFRQRTGDEASVDELFDADNLLTSGRRSTESGPSKEIQAKLDYTLPLSETNKFEAGYSSELNRSNEDNGFWQYDTLLNDYRFYSQFSHNNDYTRDIHAAYALYAGEWNRIGYQAGLRGEYTYRRMQLVGENREFTIDRTDLFPTLHMSYQFTGGQQMMASYTRRIDRPRGYFLEPFETWEDAYNVRVGNPGLKPEYIDSWEMGYQTYFGRNVFSTEFYYRITNNKINRIRSVYDQNVTLHTIENVGKDYSFGSELMLNIDLTRKWNLNLMGNVYNYRVQGALYGDSFNRESFNWSTRFNNSYRLTGTTMIQLNGRYNSPTVSSQGRREGFFVTSLAVRQDLLNKQLSATLQVRDLFDTGRFEFTSEAADLYSYSYHTREAPIVMLNLRYNINNYKVKREDQNREQDNGMEGQEDF